MAVSKRLRYEILRRDNHTCRYCGASAPDVPLRVDHVTPVALGGTDTPDNLVAACEPCNSGKSSTIIGTVAPVAGASVPPTPDALAKEVVDLWLEAFGNVYDITNVTFSQVEEVRLGAIDMYRMGLTADSLRRSGVTCGFKGDTFIGLSETSEAEWLLVTTEAFRVWRSLWHRGTGYTEWPVMDDIFLFECSSIDAMNAGVDRMAVMRAAAAAGLARSVFIENFLEDAVRERCGL
ncbi:HNH endonuclease [Streptomyces acidiscabies]|uniref:HNH endonuclease n=1 Tax=Streptomyces acidiscabies TaxID=42234 RepID=UPI0009534FE0|nr:HNH endonuclease [Streptomyces acidiscabies]